MKVPKEREKLIALSDLNREDNIKYISSEAQGIAIALDSDRYAPTLCKLERAYICGRRKSEEQIEQLEKANEMQALRMKERDELLSELEKENRELKCFIRDLIYENHNLCFQFSNTTCLFNSDYRNRAEELIGEKL